jgi:tetratricopeptide (TPR) repeat protein
MKIKTWPFLTLLYFLPVLLYAQHNQKLDSLYQAYQNQPDSEEKIGTVSYLFNAVLYTDPEEALGYAREELALSIKYDRARGVGMANYHLGVYYSVKSELDSANWYFEKALNAFKDYGGKHEIGLAYSALAMGEFEMGHYDKALAQTDSVLKIYNGLNDHYRSAVMHGLKSDIYNAKGQYRLALNEGLKSLRVLDTINKPIRKAEMLITLGDIEYQLNEYQKSMTYASEALPIYEQYQDSVSVTYALNDISRAHLALSEYKEALPLLERSVQLARKLEIKQAEATALYHLGEAALKQGNYTPALSYLSEAKAIFRQIGFQKQLADTYLFTARTYLNLNQYNEALLNLGRARTIYEEIGSYDQLGQTYKLSAGIYKQLGDNERALNDYQTFHYISDTVLNVSKSKQIEELRMIYESEKKEQAIINQQNEIALLQQKAKVNQLQLSMLVTGLILLVIIASLGYYAIRQKMRRNKLIREKLDDELAHRQKQLTTHALHLAQKNEVLEALKDKVKELKEASEGQQGYHQLIKTINSSMHDDDNWTNFKMYFEEVHGDFYGNIKTKYPELTSNELRLLALMKLNLSTKEIAGILNVSAEGVKKARYRLRKKMNIKTEESLQDYVLSI